MSSHILNQQMSMDSIVPSKDNARNIDVKSVSFLELMESIKAGGVQIPIHVWQPADKRKKNIFEIRCGERRWRACKILKHNTIPAIVHHGISYEVAMLLTITENKFHDPLKPLEEVEEISRCMENLDGDAKLIASLTGQTEQWVRLRVNIHRNLCEPWRQAFVGHPHFTDWSIGHLTLIARLPATAQRELLKSIETRPWLWERVSVKDLDGRLSQSLMLLVKAKWGLDDKLILPKAGACSSCTKRSGSEPVLWFGGIKEQIKTKDRCLDPDCWGKKLSRYLEQRAKHFNEKFENLTYRSLEHLDSEEKAALTEKFGRVYDVEDVERSTSGAKNAVPSLVVSKKGAGMITFIKEKKFGGPGMGGAKRAGKVTPLKERREKLKCKRWAQVMLLLADKIDQAETHQLKYSDKETCVMALSACFGNTTIVFGLSARKQFDALVKPRNKEKVLQLLWTNIKPSLRELIAYGGPASQIKGDYTKCARWLGNLLKIDIDKMFAEVSKAKGFTVPKSWASLNEDGTPRKRKMSSQDLLKKIEAKKSKAAKKPKVAKKKADKTLKVDFRKSKTKE